MSTPRSPDAPNWAEKTYQNVQRDSGGKQSSSQRSGRPASPAYLKDIDVVTKLFEKYPKLMKEIIREVDSGKRNWVNYILFTMYKGARTTIRDTF